MAKLLGSRADAIHDVRDVDAAAGHALDNRDAPGAKRATKRKARSSRVGKHAALNLRPSRFVGVSHKTLKTWRAKIRVDGKLTCLGSFADEIEAARAYDAHVITKNLDRAVNFPKAGGHRPKAKRQRSSLASIPNPAPSRFVGISWGKTNKVWRARIRVDGKSTYLGCFTNEIEAARAYDAHVITKNLDRAVNFPKAGGHRPQAKKTAKPGSVQRSSVASIPNPGPTRFVGITYDKRHKAWRAAIRVDGERISLGSFADEIEAARAFDAHVITKKLDRAVNFPEAGGHRPQAKKRHPRSRFMGVYRNSYRPGRIKRGKAWAARITVDGKLTSLGSFADEIEAARAYDAHVITKKLDRAVNFPEAGGHRPQAKAWSDGEGEEGDEGEWTDHACVDRSAAHSYSTRSRSRVRVRQVESQPSPPRT
jgi:hypothetical protein